jgi:PAS domain S-box-containing protein
LNVSSPVLILAVDDEPDLRILTKEFLEASGLIKVDTAGSVFEARAMIAQKCYDVIVSDYQMPCEDGIQFLKSLRASGDTTPFILFTGKGREEVVIEAFDNGADAYLQKGGEPRSLFVELENRIGTIVRRHKAEVALLDSESEFRTLFENNPDSVVLVNIDGEILNTNLAGANLVSMSKEDIIGRTIADLGVFSSEDVALFQQNMVSKFKGEPVSPVLSQVRRKDGTSRWVEIRSSTVNKVDRCDVFQVIIRDITERKNAEESLRKSEGKFRAIFNEAAVGITTIAKNGKPLEFNDRLADYLGYSREELSQMSFFELTYSEDREANLALFNDLVAGNIDHFEIEKRYVRKNGEIVWARLSEKLVEAEDDEPPLILGIIDDLNELKRAEDARKESGNRLESLVRTIPDMIWLKDADGVFLSCNRMFERLFGAKEEDIVGKTDYDFVDRDLADFFRENDRKAIEVGMSTSNEERLTFKDDGHHALYETVKTPLFDDRGTLIGVLGIGRDITEHKRMEETLKQNNVDLNAVNQQLTAAEEEMRKQLDVIIKGQDELRQETYLLETLMESLPGIFYMYDAETQCLVNWNRNHQEVSGYTEEEMLGKHVLEWHRAENKERVMAAIEKVMVTGQASMEAPLVMKDGREVPYLLTATRLDIKDSSYFMGVGIDLTERYALDRHMQELNHQMLEQEHRFSRLMEQSFDAIITHSDGKLVEANDMACKIIGARSVEDYVGCPVSDFFGSGSEQLIDERVKYLYSRPGIVAPPIEEKFRRLDGTSIDVEVMATSYLEGMRPTVQVVFRDITERKRLEKELRDSEEFHRQLMSNLSLGVVIIDPMTRTIETVNEAAAAMFGSSEGDIVGQRCYDHLCSGLEGACPVSDRGTEVKDLERTLVCADGTKRPILKTVKRINIRGQEKMLECFMDITERERVQSALRETNKKLNLLSSITRHDISNQLMSLTGYLALIGIEQSDAQSAKNLQRARTAAEMISAMVQFTKTYEDIGIKAPTWQNVRTLIEKSAKEVNLGKITIVNDVPPGTEIFSDPLISKVFLNLIQNAKVHGGDVTSIRFSVERREAVQAIICEDDGVGIPEEMKEKLFTKGFGKDHGFGLFLSREILNITNITITEEGELGRGAKFVLCLPRDGFRVNDPSSSSFNNPERRSVPVHLGHNDHMTD